MMDLDANYEDMLEHVCGFCNKIFKKEMKLDKHIMIKHQLHPETSEKEEEDIKSEDAEMMVKEESLEVKSEPELVMDAKIRKMPRKYDNLYGFDPINKVWICGSCGSNFFSDHGMRNHLNVTICGFGEKENYKPKLNYKSLYMKDAGQLICCGCGSVYNSEHGMHYHLKWTTCGFGTKEKSPPKKDYTPFYKVENSIHICLVCGVNYDTIRGMHYHLQKKCGADAQAKIYSLKQPGTREELKRTPREKKNFKQFYRKEDNSTFTCLGCETVYQSSRGVHSHLNTTKCGFGDKFRSPPKTCYLKMYRREGDQFFCLGCGKLYGSGRGVHHHLNNTKCGFGEKENGPPRKNYTPLYNKEDGLYECKRCAFKVPYIHGIHRHIKSCVAGFLEELSNLAEEERKSYEMVCKDEVGDVLKAKENGLVEKERKVVGMHDKEMYKAADVETRKPVEKAVDEQTLDMLKTNDATGELLDEMNILNKAEGKVVKMHIEDEFGEMIEAFEAESIEEPPANFCLNFMDVPLD